jgi:hypothetical protein
MKNRYVLTVTKNGKKYEKHMFNDYNEAMKAWDRLEQKYNTDSFDFDFRDTDPFNKKAQSQ